MATIGAIPDITGLDKAEQLAALRRSMAAIPERRDHAPTGLDDEIPSLPVTKRTSTERPCALTNRCAL